MRNKILLKCAINAGCKSVRDFAKFIRENSNKNRCLNITNISQNSKKPYRVNY